MGNFSRNTFDPAKRYTAVRLQQGVPLVDADWNELQDVTRHELYDALALAMPNGLTPAMVLQAIGTNDIQLTAGTAVVAGRPVRLSAVLRYTTQRYANAATAGADGVQPVPPLTTPSIARTDVAFLDIFEREVRSSEDATIVNPAIGVETSVRLCREIVLRVAENATAPPAPPAGHSFLAVALLNRTANTAAISQAMIDDIAPRPQQRLIVDASFSPVFIHLASTGSTANFGPWLSNFSSPTLQAFKPAGATALGILPLYFPDGARLRFVRYRGSNSGSGSIVFQLWRIRLDNGVFDAIAQDIHNTNGEFDRTVATASPTNRHVVDNATFSYAIEAHAVSNPADVINLRGINVRYVL